MVIPNSAQLSTRVSICRFDRGSLIPSSRLTVGTPWSMVDMVRSGRRTGRPATRRLSNA
jgi:hypothetical protein